MSEAKKPEWMSAEEWEDVNNISSPALKAAVLALRGSVAATQPEVGTSQPEPRKSAKVIQLPLWPEPQRASPNAFLRSAVFPAIQGKTRRYKKQEVIAAQAGYEIRFTGQELDQSDFDIWLQAAHFAMCSSSRNECCFTARGFLKSIGRTGGGNDIEWLKTRLAVLQGSVVEIKIGAKWVRLNLLVRASGDDDTTAIMLKFDPITLMLFASDDWTALQWEERRRLKGKPLALWLHGYFSSHAAPYPVKVETLRDMCGSETKEKKHFAAALKRAFIELKKASAINGVIDDKGLVVVTRTPSSSQGRHLIKKKTGQRKGTKAEK